MDYHFPCGLFDGIRILTIFFLLLQFFLMSGHSEDTVAEESKRFLHLL